MTVTVNDTGETFPTIWHALFDDPAEIAQNFTVYQNCADALAEFDPVPELAITRLDYVGVCPDIQILVEVTNLGCVDAT